MSIILADRVLDLGLNVLSSESRKFSLCSSLPATYNDATLAPGSGGFCLALYDYAAPAFGPIAASGSPVGRKVTLTAIINGSVTTNGTAGYWAVVDSVNSRLLASGQLDLARAITTGVPFKVNSFDIVFLNASSGTVVSATSLTISNPVLGVPIPGTTGGGGGTLPAGVTLRAIDGETLSNQSDPTSMSMNYYGRATADKPSFTYCTNRAFNGASWDDPSFWMFGDYYGSYFYAQSDVDAFKALGLNATFRMTQDSNYALAQSNGIWMINGNVSTGSASGVSTYENTFQSGTVACHMDDNYQSLQDFIDQIQITPNAQQDGRFFQVTGGHNWFYYQNVSGVACQTIMGTLYTTPNGTKRHWEVQACDEYFFAIQIQPAGQYRTGLTYNLGRSATQDETARGSHYGDIIDKQRSICTTYPAPIYNIIETYDGQAGPPATVITAAQINWAVWAGITHGARGTMYFAHTIRNTVTANNNQVAATNAFVQAQAPMINTPFAIGFATVSPARYVFPVPDYTMTKGIDICVHIYNGKFYIIATTSFSDSDTNIAATFTIKAQAGVTTVTRLTANGYTSDNTVINLTAGGTQFTDTFATARQCRIYRVG
jgi:hypothetical protein